MQNTAQNKEAIRESLLSHLKTMQDFGIENIIINNTPPRELENAAPQEVKKRNINTLEDLELMLKTCTRCKLHTTRNNLVYGLGNPNADLMFIGEGPGAEEDAQGIPFVGRAGQLLTKMIEAMGYTRDNVYIGNIVKCRPPQNRNPEPDEMEACMPFLKKQISFIKPKVIVCLGKFASQNILETQIPISKLRGSWGKFEGITVMPTFHPAFLLRNPSMKRFVWEDLQKVMSFLKN